MGFFKGLADAFVGGWNEAYETEATRKYEKVNLKDMVKLLETNENEAWKKYKGKYIEVAGKVSETGINYKKYVNYIILKPIELNDTYRGVYCYHTPNTKNSAVDEICNKKSGQKATIKGKVERVDKYNYYLEVHLFEKEPISTVDLQTMINDIKANTLKAERTYQGSYVQFIGQINKIDNKNNKYGYIDVKPLKTDKSTDYVRCEIKSEDQYEKIMEMAVGKQVAVRGEITSIGSLPCCTLDIQRIK